ncbi:MAG: YkgJ family cysteine cluster protein [Gammaproteobacteria bacterium]|nr:YkgJ family cysteine cluster protein [Gammaproteobacteria bacterium]
MWYTRKSVVRFECTGCGRCCTGSHNTHYIEVSSKEQRAIQEFLAVSSSWFRKRYLVPVAEDMTGIAILDTGSCTFLKKDNTCKIYPVRPKQCQTYPFWPEIMHSPVAWNREKLYCEGIGKGEPISTVKIKKLIRESNE